jgi:hypothetical protein
LECGSLLPPWLLSQIDIRRVLRTPGPRRFLNSIIGRKAWGIVGCCRDQLREGS